MKVFLSGSIKSVAGGREALELEAKTIHQLLQALEREVPALASEIEQGVAVSIDGQIFRDDWFQKIPLGAEIFILPKLAGG